MLSIFASSGLTNAVPEAFRDIVSALEAPTLPNIPIRPSVLSVASPVRERSLADFERLIRILIYLVNSIIRKVLHIMGRSFKIT